MKPSSEPDRSPIDRWWKKTYPQLAADLGFDETEDRTAAFGLSQLLWSLGKDQVATEKLRISRDAVVAGAADTLRDDLERRPVQPHEVLVVADGALGAALAPDPPPHLVVTDLDGDPERLRRLNEEGVPLAVHAHGDNRKAIETWVPRFTGPIVATRQTPGPHPRDVLCPGGFADGDRAVFLAHRLGAQKIRLVGFDLYGPPGEASPTDRERKKRKMRWSARLLEEAKQMGLPLEGTGTRHPRTLA